MIFLYTAAKYKFKKTCNTKRPCMSQEAIFAATLTVLLAAEQFYLIGKGRGVNFRLRERS